MRGTNYKNERDYLTAQTPAEIRNTVVQYIWVLARQHEVAIDVHFRERHKRMGGFKDAARRAVYRDIKELRALRALRAEVEAAGEAQC